MMTLTLCVLNNMDKQDTYLRCRNSLAELTISFVWHFLLSIKGPFCDETRSLRKVMLLSLKKKKEKVDDEILMNLMISVMGTNTRAFNPIFELAQQKLRNTFGMELAELPSRVGLDQEYNNEEENEARKVSGIKKKG